MLKDFGADRASAIEAVRLILDLRVNQIGTVKGSSPPFEYWLADGKPPRVANARAVILPVFARRCGPRTSAAPGSSPTGRGACTTSARTRRCQAGGGSLLEVRVQPARRRRDASPTMFVPLTDPVQAGRE